jgi:hypothetical protein
MADFDSSLYDDLFETPKKISAVKVAEEPGHISIEEKSQKIDSKEPEKETIEIKTEQVEVTAEKHPVELW